MTKIIRDPESSSKDTYDLLIIGGGIYGIMLSLEAVRRNLRPLLLEKNDFISGTTLNHLRTVHGGVRYLQSMDIHRFRESVQERKWFLKHFPQFVNVLPCLLPLYGKGLYRNSIFRIGLLINDILSFNRNFSINDKNQHLSNCKVISASQTAEIFPAVDRQGLTGAALWYDANVEENQRLMMELLKLAASKGATALNYVEAKALLKDRDQVTGVIAKDNKDNETSREYSFKAPVIINAAGPWCREVADTLDKDNKNLFKKRLLVWNILFNREAPSSHALGLSPGKGSGHNYFFHPWKNRLLVGTGEKVVEKSDTERIVPQKEIERFLKDMNTIIPGLKITETDIQRIYTGILPAEENGTMTKREKIYAHNSNGGPRGLYSISGIKFTTSRLVAEKTLKRIFPGTQKRPYTKILENTQLKNLSYSYNWEPSQDKDLEPLKDIIAQESVLHLTDLILRRTSLGDHPERALKILPKLKPLFTWDDRKWNEEVRILKNHLTSGN